MSEPFIGEIRMFGFNYPPRNWALCNGQSIDINQNPALYALLGDTFGGDTRTYFNLPDFRGRVPVHPSTNGVYRQGKMEGIEYVTLDDKTMPEHTHSLMATTEAADRNGIGSQANRYFATSQGASSYSNNSNVVPLYDNSVTNVGGGKPHSNMQPYLVVNFSISLLGFFPPRN